MRQIFKRLFQAQQYDIGLHIGLEQLNLVQLKPGAAGPAVRAVASVVHGSDRQALRTQPGVLKKLLKQAFRQPFSGRRVVTCLPNDLVRTMLLSYQAPAGVPDADAVVQELRRRVPGGLDGMVIDYLPLPQDNPSRPKEAMVAMAERDKVIAYLELLSASGLNVVALDIVPAALARLLSRMTDTDAASENILLINFGTRTSYLTVVWSRGLMLDRSIEFGEQRLLGRLKRELGLEEAAARQRLLAEGVNASEELAAVLRSEFSALTAEVNKTLVYTASRTHGRNVNRIYVVGSISRYPGIEQLLRANLSAPVTVLDPFARFPHRVPETRVAELRPLSGIAAATGLALRGIPERA
jgi:type IV pilus assembly protein PilM